MADQFRDEHEGGGGFMMGLLTGTVLGAGLGMLLAPKSGSELRNQITDQANSLGRRASDAASGMVDRARDTVHRGVEQVRSRAGAAQGGSASGFGSGVGLGSTDTMSPASGGSTGSHPGDSSTGGSTGAPGGSTYTGTTGFDRDRL